MHWIVALAFLVGGAAAVALRGTLARALTAAYGRFLPDDAEADEARRNERIVVITGGLLAGVGLLMVIAAA